MLAHAIGDPRRTARTHVHAPAAELCTFSLSFRLLSVGAAGTGRLTAGSAHGVSRGRQTSLDIMS
ncbi:MAG: hypothetical protein U1F35_21125, partial [Steroidobacteraceae bacterium]